MFEKSQTLGQLRYEARSGGAGQILELIRIGAQVVQLSLSRYVFHVKIPAGSQGLVSGSLAHRRRPVLDDEIVAPGAGGRRRARQERTEGAAVHEPRRTRAREIRQGWSQIDIENEMRQGPAGGNSRAAHDQRHADILLVGRALPLVEPVLPQMKAVVGRKKNIGPLKRPVRLERVDDLPYHLVHREHALQAAPVHRIYFREALERRRAPEPGGLIAQVPLIERRRSGSGRMRELLRVPRGGRGGGGGGRGGERKGKTAPPPWG